MTTPIITVENLSKRYHLGQIGATTLRDSTERFIHRLRRRRELLSSSVAQLLREPATSPPPTTQQLNNLTTDTSPPSATQQPNNATTETPPPSATQQPDNLTTDPQDLWALKDVSFEVQPGEVLGIIGRNGAGKSTLLKILSRITEPTSGRAIIRGRVASLLEVGTGFHPELSGRENIFLNGAILGMKKAEIARKFDEIVAFSEVERFIDTPVKRYSSGMYVRLAFAVAAHLDPEILILDEVLAVGDAAFQKKCLGKMETVAKEGRTVLFVSHNMTAIEALCTNVMIIAAGRNTPPVPTPEAVARYLEGIGNDASVPIADRTDRTGKGNIRFTQIGFGGSRNNIGIYAIGDDISVCLRVRSNYSENVTVRLALSISSANDSLISCDSHLHGRTYIIPGASESAIMCTIHSPPLNLGTYYVNVAVFIAGDAEDWVTSAAKFTIESGTFDDRATTNYFPVLAKFEWVVEGKWGDRRYERSR